MKCGILFRNENSIGQMGYYKHHAATRLADCPQDSMTQASAKSEIAAAYDQWAEVYDSNQNRTRDLSGEVLRQAELKLRGRDVVEVGCGTGRNTEWLIRPGTGLTSVFALDFSEAMLARARARVNHQRVRFVQHDMRVAWPAPDRSADLVIAMLVLEHVEHLEHFFAEAARTLRAGGEVFLCELHPARQVLGKQAQFTDAKTGVHTFVKAFLHEISDYCKAAMSSGFELVSKGEWCDPEPDAGLPPRLLSLHFRLSEFDREEDSALNQSLS
jgi:ubiquinone/menaquinone biosynthesis C-methylase UbiE